MAKRGRKPKPKALHILEGTYRADRQGNAPDAERGVPDQPAEMHDEVRRAWELVSPLLDRLGVLTKVDGLALMVLSRAVADYQACCELIQPGDDVLEKDGSTYWNMRAAARDKAEARLLKMLGEFGLTPSSRMRLDVEPAINAANTVSGFARAAIPVQVGGKYDA